MRGKGKRSIMNVSYRSKNWEERILSNLADTPFSITINEEEFHCRSVEGFWQGLKCKGERRLQVFQLAGLGAKNAGAGKRRPTFEIAGVTIRVGSKEHEILITDAVREKVTQNDKAHEALANSRGKITHKVPSKSKPIFKMEKMLTTVRKELFDY